MARAKRQPTAADMVWSLAVLIIPVVLIAWFFTRAPSDEQTVPTAQWKPVLAVARKQAPYPVLAPADDPDGWRATQVSWTPKGRPGTGGEPAVRNTWRLGFLDTDKVYVAIEQGDDQIPALLDSATRSGTRDGTVRVGTATWTRYVSEDGRTRSLVRSTAAVTTVVSGDTGYDVLTPYVETLTTG